MPVLPLVVVGHVRSPVTEARDEGWGDVVARVVLERPYRGGLRGLDGFSHALVLTYLHQARFDPARDLVRRPRGLASMPLLGIFAQRAKDRPNPIGVTVVEVVSVEEDALVVRGLDAIDGTPVVDVKPYFPAYDRAEGPVVPAWVSALMRDYF